MHPNHGVKVGIVEILNSQCGTTLQPPVFLPVMTERQLESMPCTHLSAILATAHVTDIKEAIDDVRVVIV
jgi:hypothetical protein